MSSRKPHVFHNGNDKIFKLEVKPNWHDDFFFYKGQNFCMRKRIVQSEQADFGEKGNYVLSLCH